MWVLCVALQDNFDGKVMLSFDKDVIPQFCKIVATGFIKHPKNKVEDVDNVMEEVLE